MVKKLEILKDFLGNNFIGISYTENELADSINFTKDLLDESYDIFDSNRLKRDGDLYYLVAVDFMEYERLIVTLGSDKIADLGEQLNNIDVTDIKICGVGKATNNDNTAYYIIIASEFITQLRQDYNLVQTDLYITLGFNPNDVYATVKDISTLVENNSKFLKLLRKLFYNNENWNFLKDKVKNFDAESIKVINITSDYVFVESNRYINQIGLLDNGELWVFCRYPNENDDRELTQVEIRDILKNN
jgi:hypothetical protein